MTSRTKSRTAALILAAGLGKRMRSKLPKVLHLCGGVPLVEHVVSLALARGCEPVVVVTGPEGTRVRELLTARFPEAPLRFAVQTRPRGTGDAARAGLASLKTFSGRILVLYGDVPLLRPQTVQRLERAFARRGVAVAFLTAELDDPAGYGRVVRQGAQVVAVVEHRDATKAQRAIREINVGVYLCDAALLRRSLGGLNDANAQGELYLTDVVASAARDKAATGVLVEDAADVLGVNTRADLAAAEAALRRRLIERHMQHGVTFLDPSSSFIDASVRLERDVVIGVGVQLRGHCHVAAGARIDGPSVLIDSDIGSGTTVHAFSHLERASVGAQCSIGPFARLRPETQIETEAKVGNFVEVKKTRLGKGAKANHLAYLGDAAIGAGSNIGAGTITCNYDGATKHRTEVGARVFVGSNSTLVAPVKLGPGAYVAAGSTITRAVPKDALAFGRTRQVNREGYAARLRDKLATAEDERDR